VTLPTDNPIRNAKDDAIGRAPAAEAFANHVLALEVSQGVVVGVLGPWGSGKTSFINLARDHFATGATVLDFNPWMFSGAEQLVESFFIEISAQLKARPGLEEIGADLANYGEAFSGLGWLPVVGPWVQLGGRATKFVATLLRRRSEGSGGRRRKLETELAKLSRPIVVVLDDIDRLSTSEIRDVFKLVRLTANFPNIIYVLAFDRVRVEHALAEQNIPGRDYLEKILQIAVDLPAVPSDVLNRQVFAALDEAIAGTHAAELDVAAWPDVFMEIIRPLIRTMRDVRRYAAAVHGTLTEIGDQIALVDLLGMEAVRVFMPEVFRELPKAVSGLTTPSPSYYGTQEPAELKEAVEALISEAGDRQGVVRALIERLFPFGSRHIGGTHYAGDFQKTYLRDRRIAHEAILRLYLERVIGEQLRSFLDAERAFAVMTNREQFEEALRSTDADRREEVISALEAYEDEFQPEHVVPGVVVLQNMVGDLPDRPRGMFDFDARLVVGRVAYRLLKSLPDPNAVEAAVREILPQVQTLSAKWEVITDVGHREGAGHKLVSEDVAKSLESEWREEVRAAPAEALAREPDLLRVMFFAREKVPPEEERPASDKDGLEEAAAAEPPIELPDDPAVTLAALKAAKTETRSQTMGTRAVHSADRLVWDPLVKIYGDEDTLKERVEALKASGLASDEPELIELVGKYLGGWRPEDFSSTA
jgi:hypothetical protein